MKKFFIIIGSIFVVILLSIPIGLWVDVHKNIELSNKYPNPKKILVDYVASSECVPFVDDISHHDFCKGIYYQNATNTIIQSNEFSSFCFATDSNENIAVFFYHEDKFGDAETTIWFKSVGCINNSDCVKEKKAYLSWAVFNVNKHQLEKFKSFEDLKKYCNENSINLGEWYQLCDDSCPPIDIDSFVDYCRGHWWNNKWKKMG